MMRTRCYRDGKLVRENFPPAEVSDCLADPANTVWLDLCGDDAADLDVVREELALHNLAVADVVESGQRSKLNRYPEHLTVVAYALEVDGVTGELASHAVGAVITRSCLVTVRADEAFDIDAVARRWDDEPDLAANGVGFLVHGLLDYVVDSQFDAVQRLDGEIDGLEDQLFDEVTSDAQMQRRTFQLRKTLVNMRRLVLPMREVLNTLMRRDLKVIDDAMAPYYQDVYDHVLRVTEWTDELRDLLANILETRLTVRGNRLNTIMKKVTSWAAIIAVPTAVTGFYGQNVPYPGFNSHSGFLISTIVMIGGSVSLYTIFKLKDWL
jgi:magnesium transporter